MNKAPCWKAFCFFTGSYCSKPHYPLKTGTTVTSTNIRKMYSWRVPFLSQQWNLLGRLPNHLCKLVAKGRWSPKTAANWLKYAENISLRISSKRQVAPHAGFPTKQVFRILSIRKPKRSFIKGFFWSIAQFAWKFSNLLKISHNRSLRELPEKLKEKSYHFWLNDNCLRGGV